MKAPDNDMAPVASKGDLVLVHIQEEIEDRKTFLIYLKAEKKYTIKKIIETKSDFELFSMNASSFPTTKENFRIIGKIIKADVENFFE